MCLKYGEIWKKQHEYKIQDKIFYTGIESFTLVIRN